MNINEYKREKTKDRMSAQDILMSVEAALQAERNLEMAKAKALECKKTLGSIIAQLRIDHNLSQRELAEFLRKNGIKHSPQRLEVPYKNSAHAIPSLINVINLLK